MVATCPLCGLRGTKVMRSFPANSLPDKQKTWLDLCNLMAEEHERFLREHRDILGRIPRQRLYWCSRHFDENSKFPIDRRSAPILVSPPDPASMTPIGDIPLDDNPLDDMPSISRQISEISVSDAKVISSAQLVGTVSPSTSDPVVPAVSRETTTTTDKSVTDSQEMYDPNDTGLSSQDSVDSTVTLTCSPLNLHPYLLVSSAQLLQLFNFCPGCGDPSIRSITSTTVGSAVSLKWKCNGCKCDSLVWRSQPLLDGRFYEGNLKFVTAAHTTALPLSRVTDFGDVMGLALPAQRTFHDQLTRLVLPAVDAVYTKHMSEVQQTVRNAMDGRGLDLSTDGRYSNPGYTASSCTVSVVDLNTNLIIMIANLHKSMSGIDGISGRMEKEGVRRSLKNILALRFKIRTLCTDNDARIGKMMREEFPAIQHLLDFWHLIKGVNHNLRELSKKKDCPNVSFWRRKLINHAYYLHFKYARNRQRGLMYWLSALAHVCGRHSNFQKVPFLKGISKCKHLRLGPALNHQIDRKSKEFQLLKAVIMKPTFNAGFLRASPKKNTSPNECYNSIINLYAPKRLASSALWYGERVKLATLHFNTLAHHNLLGMRKEVSNTSVNVKGREASAVKRKMSKVVHAWRQEVWAMIPRMIEGRQLDLFFERNHVPSNRAYILALQQEEEEDTGEGGEEGDGWESDRSEELGGPYGDTLYGEEADSDTEPVMAVIELSDVEDEESDEEEGEEGSVGEEEEERVSSGSEWEEGELEEIIAVGRGGRGRGVGRGRGGRGRGNAVAPLAQRKKKDRDSDSDSEPPVKRGKGRESCIMQE